MFYFKTGSRINQFLTKGCAKSLLYIFTAIIYFIYYLHTRVYKSPRYSRILVFYVVFVCTISCNDSALWAIARDLCMGGNTYCSLRCAWLWRNPLFWGGLNQTCKSIWKLSQKRCLKVLLCCPSIYSLVASKLPTVQCCDLLSWSELGLL